MIVFGWCILFIALAFVLAFQRAAMMVWSIAYAILLLVLTVLGPASTTACVVFWAVFVVLVLFLQVPMIRMRLLTRRIFRIYKKLKPAMSETEQQVISAGHVGWEAELFTGMPDWEKFNAITAPKLSAEEQAFMDGPVEEICTAINDWDITHNWMKIPPKLWDFLRTNGFFAMIIPKRYGGLEFSAYGHAAVIAKIAGASVTVATVTGVPNSLGPGELLLHYGTEDQKNYYLPRLASGEEVPCFALTSRVAGSDAASIMDYGIVCKRTVDGKEVLGMSLNWDKRYITLSPVATLLGLAFKLYDPDHLLGDKEDLGITCAFVPVKTPGITIGRRHFPLNSAFPNGPTQGKDVFVSVDQIVGGPKRTGQGWKMLMECLAAGRCISIPSTVTGGSKHRAIGTGYYSRIRKQFNVCIGAFGGVEEALARVGAYTYLMEALRTFAVGGVDRGEESAVASAITKYHASELARIITNDSMDIHGGKGICMGPHNYLARGYQEMPIALTVEGANILTRCLIIFGQGAIRCHPYVLTEMLAADNADAKAGLRTFDKAIFAHFGFIISNKVRAFILGITNGHLARVPGGKEKRYLQHFTRFSSAFAFLVDTLMISLGAKLKRMEQMSGRLGDILSYLYLGSALIKFYQTTTVSKEDEWPVVEWLCQDLLFKVQTTIDEILQNIPNRLLAAGLRLVIFPCGRRFKRPSDKLGSKIAKSMLYPSSLNKRLAENVYMTPNDNNPIGQMAAALPTIIAAEELENKLQRALRKKEISGVTYDQRVAVALDKGIINKDEAEVLMEVYKIRLSFTDVDDFSDEELSRRGAAAFSSDMPE